MKKTIRTPHLTLTVKTGSEGPRWDPYGYVELQVFDQRTDRTVVLHQGLGDWLKVDGEMRATANENPAGVFKDLLGFSPGMVERWMERVRHRCGKCFSKRFEWQAGYPGESLKCCTKCGEVCDYEFNEQAII